MIYDCFRVAKNALLIMEDETMPNDLTTQRNSLNWRTDTRQPLENKGFFPRGGGGVYLDNFGLNACGV